MKKARGRLKPRLSVDQCMAAIEVLEHETLRSPPSRPSAVSTLVKIAHIWERDGISGTDKCHLIRVCRDVVYIDRADAETIIYARGSGMYCIGYPTRAADSWAAL